jgi:cell wall-associated NlpC family hydrolase
VSLPAPERQFSAGAVVAAVLIIMLGIAAAGVAAAHAFASSGDKGSYIATEAVVAAEPASYRIVQKTVTTTTEPAPIGRWTAERGRQIAQRALKWLNWPYSFAAGNGNGPTFGAAVDADSRNDGKVYGFDCSGLTMYAVAPWLEVVHDAASQYKQVGSFHPTLDTLYPGDLVFWTKDGTIGGIGHVGIYVGDGKVVQAPHSGSVVQVTPIYEVESGEMGATRPLT